MNGIATGTNNIAVGVNCKLLLCNDDFNPFSFIILGEIHNSTNKTMRYFAVYDYCDKKIHYVIRATYQYSLFFIYKYKIEDIYHDIHTSIIRRAFKRYDEMMPRWIILILSVKYLFSDEIYDILRHLTQYYIFIAK